MKKKIEFPEEFLKHVSTIKNKRALVLINHIMKNGFMTTEELEKAGYKHPPRAARDVREIGVPLETFNVKSSEQGKSIAAYRFGDLATLNLSRIKGRTIVPKAFKKELFVTSKGKCSVCNGEFEERYFQVDHRVPYQVAGDEDGTRNIEDFMLLCGSCNRAKSWSCEHCPNWKGKDSDPSLCKTCYWGNPQEYTHIALKEARRLDLHWSGIEVKDYDSVRLDAKKNNIDLPELVKKIVSSGVNK
jgi:hypothetical protein